MSKDGGVENMKLFRKLVYDNYIEGYEGAYENLFKSSKTQKY